MGKDVGMPSIHNVRSELFAIQKISTCLIEIIDGAEEISQEEWNARIVKLSGLRAECDAVPKRHTGDLATILSELIDAMGAINYPGK